MTKSFAEKSKSMTFLGLAVLMSAAAVLLHSCNKKTEKIKEPKLPQLKPEAKVETPKTTSNKRVIYLTFDDGPNKGTENLMRIAHERKVPITSFIIGKHVFGSKKQLEIFEKLKADTLIELSNHSFTHANNHYSSFYGNPEKVVSDFKMAEDSLKLSSKTARTPGRNIWRLNTIVETDIKSSKNSADALQNNGFKLIGWDLEWKPNQRMQLKGSHEQMLKRVDSIFFNDLEKTSRHLVFLTHDQYLQDENSVMELDLFIQKLQKTNRFEFKKISEYPKIKEILN